MSQIGLSRIPFIDTAKGLCIMLVVLYHINTYYDIPEIGIVASFHMPLFFLLSGCFYKSYGSFKLFCTKKTNNKFIIYKHSKNQMGELGQLLSTIKFKRERIPIPFSFLTL